ncbi:MAG: proprotein convertase P-domain-containing protein [Saprospiraceae bacterium]|nr:proprotein convertase P-domain-containing protein [Saprospiraceae bacterium]
MKWTTTILFSFLFALASLNAQTYQMDGSPITDCSGFFTDSGGSGNMYGPNESLTTTICSDFSSGTHVRLNFSGVDIGGGDLLCFYDGVNTGAPLLSCNTDFLPGAPFIIQATAANPGGCVTIEFMSDGAVEGDGWSAAISCIPACQIITSVLENSMPAVEPVDTGYIDICPGDIVFFEGTGLYPQNGIVYNHSDLTSTFHWDFGDGNFGLGPNASHLYDEPGGYTVQLTITDQFGCTNTNFISQRIRVAPPPSFSYGGLIPDPLCAGDTLSLNSITYGLDSTLNLSINPSTGTFDIEGARSDSLPLPDGTGVAYETGIGFTEFSPGQVLSNINDLVSICVNIEHSWMRDLEISIECPNGAQVILHNHPGPIGGEVFLGEPFENDEGLDPPIPGIGYDYCWTPDATAGTWIEYANANNPGTLPEGDYNSFEPLTNLLGCPLNGEWVISVEDLWGIDNGYIFSWSIEFDPSIYPNVETFTPDLIDYGWVNNPTIFDYTQDSIQASPVNAGTASYAYFVEDEFGCVWDTAININILPYLHPDCYSCTDILQPEPDTAVCDNEVVQLDASVDFSQEIPTTFEAFPFYPFGFGNHPPAAPYNSVISVNSIYPLSITNPFTDIISVCIDIETDFLSDIAVFLKAPNGSMIELTSGNGGGSDFYTQTCFTPAAVTPITAGTTPFTGDFQPEGNWNVLGGTVINGDWQLLVSDAFGPTAMGVLNSWSITFRAENDVVYTWSPGSNLDCVVCPDPLASPPLGSNTYFVTAQDIHDCVQMDTLTIDVLASYDAPAIVCNQNTNGEIIFSWNMVNGVTDYLVNVDGTGWVPANGILMHTVGGLTNGDMVSIEVQVDVPSSLCPVQIGDLTCTYNFCGITSTLNNLQDPSCAGDCDGTVDIGAVGGNGAITYTIIQLDGLYTYDQPNGQFSALCAGDHLVIMEDITGCLDSISFSLTEPAGMMADIFVSQPISCNGDANGQVTVVPSGGAGNYSYLWDDPLMQILPTASFLPTGQINVEVTDENDCTITLGLFLDEPDPIVLGEAVSDVLCFGESTGEMAVTVVGGTYPYNYSWNDPAMTIDSVVIGVPADPYQVIVTDANGCTESLDMTVAEPASAITASANQVDISCFNENTSTAIATGMGGTGSNYSYSWNVNQQTQTAVNLPPGNYAVTITDENDCEAFANVNIVQYDTMELLVIFAPPTCNGLSNGSLAVTDVDGGSNSGILNYTWSANPAINDDVITGLPGNQLYEVTVTDDQGCSVSESVFMPEPEAIILTLSADDVLCHGDTSGTATVVNVVNEAGAVQYLWSANADAQTSAAAIDLPAGTYSVTVTDANGCTATGSIGIEEPTQVVADFDVIENECFGDAEGIISANPSGGTPNYTYEWSTGSTSAKLDGLPVGFYTVTIKDANGCAIIEEIEMTSPAPILPGYIVEDVSCFGYGDGLIVVEPSGGVGPFQYSLDGEFYSGSSSIIGLEAGVYNIFTLDANGCEWLSEVPVFEPPAIELVIVQAPEVVINLGDIIDLFAYANNEIGPTSYTWIEPYLGTLDCNDCFNPTVTTQNTITYEVVVVDSLGCTDSDFVTVRVEKERVVEVPTGFSPNNDGENDLLLVHGKEGTIVNLFRVYDRWGELLYENNGFFVNDPTVGWNGEFRSQPMGSGVYIWYLEVTYIDGVTESFKGGTTLIR